LRFLYCYVWKKKYAESRPFCVAEGNVGRRSQGVEDLKEARPNGNDGYEKNAYDEGVASRSS